MRGGRTLLGLLVLVLVGCAADGQAPATAGAASDTSDAPGAVVADSEAGAALGDLCLVLVAADGARWELRDGEEFDAWLAGITSAPPVEGRLVLSARSDQEFKRLQRVMRGLGALGLHDIQVLLLGD